MKTDNISAALTNHNNPVWRIHTKGLLEEILKNPGTEILNKPLLIFDSLLRSVAERAAELNDDRLNALMCRLALYAISDPYDKSYDFNKVEEIIFKGTRNKTD